MIGKFTVGAGAPTSIAFLSNSSLPWVAVPTANEIGQLKSGSGSFGSTFNGINSPNLLAASGTDLWVVSSANDALYHLSGSSGTLSQVASFVIPSNAVAVAADSSQVWVAHSNGSGSSLTYLTISSGATGSVSITETPSAVSLDSTNAWVTAGTNHLYQINRSNWSVSGPVQGVGSQVVTVDSKDNIWTAGTSLGVSYVAAGSTQGVTFLPSSWGRPSVMAYDSTDSNIWVNYLGQIAWFNPQTVVSNPLSAASAITTGNLPISPTGIAIDASGNIWLVDSVGTACELEGN